jgi:hypothetical protein
MIKQKPRQVCRGARRAAVAYQPRPALPRERKFSLPGHCRYNSYRQFFFEVDMNARFVVTVADPIHPAHGRASALARAQGSAA